MSAKKVVFLGVGGHGWGCFFRSIQHLENCNFYAYNLPVDFGGSAGLWYKLQELNEMELNVLLHGSRMPVLPWGDHNKTVKYFFAKRFGNLVADILDFRSNVYEDHLEKIEILTDFFKLDRDELLGFNKYFEIAFNYYLNYKDQLGPDVQKGFCLGYPWQEFAYWQLGKVADVNKFYHQKSILPKNLNLLFSSDDRLLLTATNINSENLEGEDIIDTHNVPIRPESYQLQTSRGDGQTKFSAKFLQDLQEASLIVISPGSYSNWLAYFNHPETLAILQQKSKNQQLLWLTNLDSVSKQKATNNELLTKDYLDWLKALSISPILWTGPEEASSLNYPSLEIKQMPNGYYDVDDITEKFPILLDKTPA